MNPRLELWYPFDKAKLTQPYGPNGHVTTDWQPPNFGDPVRACQDGYVYSVLNKDNPDPDRYRAVYTIVEMSNGLTDLCEISYGHFDEIHVQPGDFVRAGDILGTCGNTGEVYAGGRRVTSEERLSGSKAGYHLHGPQVRAVERVRQTASGNILLSTSQGTYRDEDGYYYVRRGNPQFAGCVDPALFWNGRPASLSLFLRSVEELGRHAQTPEQKRSVVDIIKAFFKPK